MRYSELFEDDDDTDIIASAKNTALDVLAMLSSQKISYITVDRMIKYLNNNSDVSGINIDKKFVIDLLKNVPTIKKIEPDEHDVMTIYLRNGEAANTNRDAEKDAEKIHSNAMKTLKKSM